MLLNLGKKIVILWNKLMIFEYTQLLPSQDQYNDSGRMQTFWRATIH